MSVQKINSDGTRKRRGRPKDSTKTEAILREGWEEFLSVGLEGASVDSIARRAGVSRVTLYGQFENKEELFKATIRREMTRLEESQVGLGEELPLRERLIRFGVDLMRFVSSPTAVSFYSVLAADLKRYPDLARAFYDLGPGVTHRNLRTILRRAHAKGELVIDSAGAAAEELIGLWEGLSHYKLILGIGTERERALIPKRVEHAVDVFLRAYGGMDWPREK